MKPCRVPSSWLVVVALLLGPASAGAADPLPSPPFVGGFVAPSLVQMADEAKTSRTLFAYSRKHLDCHLVALLGIQRAAGDAVEIALAVSKLTTCLARREAQLLAATDKLLARGTLPACLGLAAIVGLQHDLEATVQGALDALVCEGPIEPASGLAVPAAAAAARAEVRLAKTYSQGVEQAGRCFDRGALAVAAAAGDAGAIAAAVTAHAACMQKVADSRHAKAQKLLDGGDVPACAAAVAHPTIDVALAIGGGITTDIYCGQ